MSEVTTHYLTKDEAVRYVKRNYRRGVTYFVSLGGFLYTKTPDECTDGENPRGYEAMGNLKVSQRDALNYVDQVLRGTFVDKGCRIKVSDHPSSHGGCIFLG